MILMLAIILSLLGILGILLLNELLWRHKIIHGELKRKLVHMTVMTFVAFWPWLMSFRSIQLVGIAMVIVLLLNRQLKFLHYLGGIREKSYGDIFLALAITTSALITDEKTFFMIAMLNVALADGLAAVIGSKFGGNWRYKVFGQNKSVIGTMTFWITSVFVFGFGLLPAHSLVEFNQYILLLIFLPPILAAVENIAVFGLDNLAVPIVVITVLNAVS